VLAVALSDEVKFLDGRLALHPAVRVERIGDDSALSPGIAAVVAPFSGTSALSPLELRAGWGRSFRAPTLTELYLDQGNVLPNPGLRPERAWSIDAGIAWNTEKALLSIGGFWSRYANLILYELNPPLRVRPYNAGAARIAGIETRAMVALPHRFFIEASYTFMAAVNLRDSATQGGQDLAYRPPHRFFARGAHRGDRFEGYLEGELVSAMARTSFGTAQLPGRTSLNAGAGARVAGPLWIDLEAKNLLDARTQQDLFQYPLPGLSLAVIARARL
jgi:iron complex outermembrane receptor protein